MVESGRTGCTEDHFRVATLNSIKGDPLMLDKLRRFFYVTEARLNQSRTDSAFKECGGRFLIGFCLWGNFPGRMTPDACFG